MQESKYERDFKIRISEIEKETGVSGKNDHYVPQFLLRNFGIKDGSKKPEEIFEYTRQLSESQKVRIENVASDAGHYDIKKKSTQKKNNLFDRLVQPIENDASLVFKKLTSDAAIKLSNKEENILANFMAFLYVGTPSFREQIKHFLLYLLENRLVKIEELDDQELLNRIFNENKFKISIETLVKYRPKSEIILKNHDLLIIIGTLIAIKLSEEFFYRHINILESSGNDYFLISDNPVFISDLKKNPRWPAGWSFRKDQSVFLPISPNRCLVLDNGPFNKQILKADSDYVGFIVFNIIVGAENHVYSFLQDKDIQIGFDATKKMREQVFRHRPLFFLLDLRKWIIRFVKGLRNFFCFL